MKATNHARHLTPRAGFSLVEMTVAVGILGLIFGAVGLFQMRSQGMFQQSGAQAESESKARRAMMRVLSEISGISNEMIDPDPTGNTGTDQLSFQVPTSVNGAGVVSWSSESSLTLPLDEGELDNGADDDGDGLVDERRLVLTRNVGAMNERAITLCHGVAEWYPGETGNGTDENGNGVTDERGFNLRRTGDLMEVRLAVQTPFGDGQIATWTVDTALVLRN